MSAALALRAPAPARRHTLLVTLHDRPGALYRAVGLIRRRDYNVASLVVGASERSGTSRMVLVVEATDVRQVVQQLTRLVDVLSVEEVAHEDAIVRETALAVVDAPRDAPAVLAAAVALGARVADCTGSHLLLEITGTPERVDRFVDAMRSFDLRQLARAGLLAVRDVAARGAPPGAAPAAAPAHSHDLAS